MTDYQTTKFNQLNTLAVGKWYDIDPNRADYSDFIEAVKVRIDIRNDYLFNDTYTRFKRIKSFWEEVAEIAEVNEPIDWHSRVKQIHDSVQKELDSKFRKKQWQR